MMIEPSIRDLLKKVDSRYTLVILAAKRARQIAEDAKNSEDVDSDNIVTKAINEIIDDKITYVRTKSGIK